MSQVFKTQFAGSEISVKAHYIAGQADGAVLVTYGETVVLVTIVSSRAQRRKFSVRISQQNQVEWDLDWPWYTTSSKIPAERFGLQALREKEALFM